MVALKCKLCGGNIEITGESHGICDSCGCEVTLPKINEQKRIEMYNRGNHFRRIGDFDRAYSAYEHIIADDREDAEAHWCLMLCRFGVEYVKDARSGEYKPTLSRMSYEPVLEDPNYLQALRCADDQAQRIYRYEAQKIAWIQERYLKIARSEAPYDVFICFKAEEENGQRTKGSVLAQDIYEQLTQKGLKVFFSRITLEDKLSEEYEPYIFAALHSAKVMLLVANDAAHLQARWVRNEWRRYLSMMEGNRGKAIVPVFIDMSPYDFPSEIPMVQGQDMSKLGAMQDLVRGVMKLSGKTESTVAVSAAGGVQVRVDAMLKRARQAMADGQKTTAYQFVDQALKVDEKCVEAHLLLLYLEFGINSLEEIANCTDGKKVTESEHFKNAVKYSTGTLRRRLELLREEYEQAWNERVARDRADRAKRAKEKARKEAVQAKREAEQKRLEEELKEIKADKNVYLRRKIRNDYPEVYQGYTDLYKEALKYGKNNGQPLIFHALALAVVMVLSSYMLVDPLIPGTIGFLFEMQINSIVALLLWSAATLVLISLDYEDTFPMDEIVGAFILAIVPTVVAMILQGIFGKVIGYLVFGISAIVLLVTVKNLIFGGKWRKQMKAVFAYQHRHIDPLCKKLLAETRERFKTLVQKDDEPWENWDTSLRLYNAEPWELNAPESDECK